MLVINNNLINWKNYLRIASSLYPPGDKIIVDRAMQIKFFQITLK